MRKTIDIVRARRPQCGKETQATQYRTIAFRSIFLTQYFNESMTVARLRGVHTKKEKLKEKDLHRNTVAETMLKPTDRVVLVLGILQITLLTPLDPRAGGLLVVRVAHALFCSRVRSVVSATFAANVTSLRNAEISRQSRFAMLCRSRAMVRLNTHLFD